MGETRSLDGSDWQIKGYLGLDGALRTAARDRSGEGDGWLPATVPGTILDDLWRAGEVPDPYYERNSLLVEWVPERAWVYRRRFQAPALAAGERAWLRFEGLDHAGHVFLDGDLVGRHEGMFVPFEIELTDRLRPGVHDLAVVVEPAPDSEPQIGRTSRVRVHKSRMVYGWDFCPRLVHQGIWQSVGIVVTGAVRIVDVWARSDVSEDLAHAWIDVQVRLDTVGEGSTVVEAELAGPSGRVVAAANATATGETRLATVVLDVAGPELWWPNGMGEPALHRLTVRAIGPGGTEDTATVQVGLRRLAIVPNPGAPADAAGYTFVVNGRPLYVTGWNWVPADALYGVPRPARQDHLLRLAAAANVNLLRVWGGGLIETEAFYDACDRLGILVWQEFSQSSSGIESRPAEDSAFVDAMTREAEAIVPLRRNHPSLAAWCGGNELEGPDGPLDASAPVLGALRAVVERLDPGRPWFPTSPSGPRFHNRLDVIDAEPDGLHDVHGPWEHQGLPGHHALYDRGTSLFNSEFGVEGMTNRRTHERLVSPEHRWPATRANAVYRHLGDWWINEPVVQAAFADRLGDLESLRRASHWLQAEGLRYAIEANARRAPRHSGSLPWQFNESYPNAWCTSVVDHRGDPKPAYHAVARAYRPTVVCARFDGPAMGAIEGWTFAVWAWSRDGSVRDGSVTCRFLDLEGRCLEERVTPLTLPGSRPVEVTGPVPLSLTDPPGLFVLDLAMADRDGPVQASNRYVLSAGGDLSGLLDLAPATVTIDRTDDADPDRWRLDIRHADGPAAIGLRVEDDRPYDDPGWAEADDSGFDLLPGEHRRVVVAWADAPPEGRRLRVSGWNVAPVVVG